MAALLLLSSCASRRSLVYFQDMWPGLDYPADLKHEAVIHADDKLSIVVGSKNPELALPFNAQGGNFQVSADGNVTSPGSAQLREKGYRVDVDGNIDFPILGKLHVEGMTLFQAKELIKEKIVKGNYIKEPLVSIEFLNFRYTVLGAVGAPGTYSIANDRVTLLDAIARSGDISSNGRVDRVNVIREEGSFRKVYTHDLREKELFDSPAFYLQQNDIVYVEPKKTGKEAEDRGWRYASFLVSVASLVTSILWVLK